MEATHILMEEHRVIEGVIASLEMGANRLQSGKPIRIEFFIQAADFIKGFADGYHHMKEEGVLFPAMKAAGVPREGGPIGVMLVEHEQGRQLTRNMRLAAEKMKAGDADAKTEVCQNALGYAALLRQHILKEDNVLFPMAERVIPPAKQTEVAEAFKRVEHEETGEGVHEKYLAMAQALEQDVRG